MYQSDPLVVPLLEDLTREYTGRYGRLHEDLFTYPATRFAPPDGAFVLLVESGAAIAGGAFQKYDDDTAELKRIWTHADHRRRGLAAKVVAELEKKRRPAATPGSTSPPAHGNPRPGAST
ncbi:hypothetical protein GCM10029964_021630 [Kibdelosporangium lantanae]